MRAERVLREVFSRVVVVSPGRESYSSLDLGLGEDLVPDAGPLGGIQTALVYADGRDVFILACDHPFVEAPLVRYLITAGARAAGEGGRGRVASARVAKWNGRLYPLCGLYSAACRQAVDERLARGELIAIFDADFLPPADFLRRTLVPFADARTVVIARRLDI